ncbi:MAG: T9SS type A sorting domain-containing protein [Candidatus Eisenbacteria bacterium]|uniref:T9SS type A sorting domain-containing protein n=1 Tax=Eiseniibacteriota bacterium TaxID=2212470 RepID=A0A956SCY3_UNCEI|nr:T9SS type A sorting domain-containing protein [Candidatus Eisenbacteria bacterium]MCB9466302.1 T9SS type A sorting domain-containing protein [Candidatus Eisenbacteria bacterium]
MKLTLLLLLVLAIPSTGHAQWVRTSGPEGGYIHSLDELGGRIFAGTDKDGLYVSHDAGASWAPSNTGMEHADARRVVRKSGTLFAATSDGVYRSTDDGASWLPPSPDSPINVKDLAVTDNYVFAAAGGVYRSDDLGMSWELTDLFQGSFNCIANHGDILIAGNSSDLHRSTNEGDSWIRLAEFGARVNFSAIAKADTFLVGRNSEILRSYDSGATFERIRIPFDVTVSNIYDLDIVGPKFYAATSYDGVYESTDQGMHWSPIPTGMGPKDAQAITHLGDVLVAGTHYSGLYRSSNAGQQWVHANEGLAPGGAIDEMLVDGETVYAGTRDGLHVSYDNGYRWTKLAGGSEMVDYGTISGIAVLEGDLFVSARIQYDTTIFRRDGDVWTHADQGLPDLDFIFGLTASGNNLIAGTSAGIFFSSDHGESWQRPQIPTNGGVDEIYAAGNGTVYAILTNDGIYRSQNDGLNWERVLSQTGLVGISACGNFAYASQFHTGVWISTDGGESWGLTGFGESAFDAQCIGNGQVLVATAIEGARIFISNDSGGHFFAFSQGLSPVTTMLQFTANDSYMFAGSAHSGVWRRLRPGVSDATPQTADAAEPTLRNYPNPFGSTTRIRFDLPTDGAARLSVYDVAGRELGVLFDGEASAGSHEVEFAGDDLPTGLYLYRLDTNGRSEVGRMMRVERAH